MDHAVLWLLDLKTIYNIKHYFIEDRLLLYEIPILPDHTERKRRERSDRWINNYLYYEAKNVGWGLERSDIVLKVAKEMRLKIKLVIYVRKE